MICEVVPTLEEFGALYRDGLSRRAVISVELKWEIRNKLDQANSTERVLSPGLDGLSEWRGRHYSPKNRGVGL